MDVKSTDAALLEFHVVIDGVVHLYKGLEIHTPHGFARSHALMCGRLFTWVKKGDCCIVDTMVTCVGCLGYVAKTWLIETNVKG